MLTASPVIRRLPQDDVRSILARNHVGRLVFTSDGEVDVRPLHYVYSNGAIYSRTSPGAKIATTTLPPRVAFEVDEIESVFRWKSVIVRGNVTVLADRGVGAEEWEEAAELLRLVVKKAFEEDDPVPQRSVIFRIEVQEATGMKCS